MTSSRRADDLRTLESEVGVLIRRVKRVIGDRARAVHPELVPGQYLMLSTIDRSGPQRAAAIAEAFAMDKGAVSRSVHHLVELGLLERTDDPEDRRATLLAVSQEGSRRLASVGKERSARFDERMSGFTDAELAQLVNLMQRYNAALES